MTGAPHATHDPDAQARRLLQALASIEAWNRLQQELAPFDVAGFGNLRRLEQAWKAGDWDASPFVDDTEPVPGGSRP